MANSTEVESICADAGFAKLPKRKTPPFTPYPHQNQNPPVSRLEEAVAGSSSCRYMAAASRFETSNVRTFRNSSHFAPSRKTAVSKYASSSALRTESRISSGHQKTASFFLETWYSFHDSVHANRSSAPSEPSMTFALNSQAGVDNRKTGQSEPSGTASSKPNSQTRTSETANESAGYTGSGFGRFFILRQPKYAAIPMGKASSAGNGPISDRFGVSAGGISVGEIMAGEDSRKASICPEVSPSASWTCGVGCQSESGGLPYASKSTFSRFSEVSFRAAESMAAWVWNGSANASEGANHSFSMALAIFQEGSDKRVRTFGTSDGNLTDSESGMPFASHSARRTDCSSVTNPCPGWSARMSANISRTVSGARGGAGVARGGGTEGWGTGIGGLGIHADVPEKKTSAASTAGMAKIAPTETPTASATVAAFFSIQRERSNPSTARNAPVPAIHARTAAMQPTTANAHEDAATALQAMIAMPTPIRTFAVLCQISRRRSVFESAGSVFIPSADWRNAVMVCDLRIRHRTYPPPIRKTKKNPGNTLGKRF